MSTDEALCSSYLNPGVYDVPPDAVLVPRDVQWSIETSCSSKSSPSASDESPTRTHTNNYISPPGAHVYLSESGGTGMESCASERSPLDTASPVNFLLEPYYTSMCDDLDYDVCPFLRWNTFQSPGNGSGLNSEHTEVPVVPKTRTTRTSPYVDSKKHTVCRICNKKFTLKHDLSRHLRTLHRRQHDLVYRCAVAGCPRSGKIFSRLDNFKKHLKTAHYKENVDKRVSEGKIRSGEVFIITTPGMYLHNNL